MSTPNISAKELAVELGMSTEFVRERCRRREWPHLKPGSRVRFTPTHVAAIYALLEQQPLDANPSKPVGITARSARHHRRRAS